MLTNYIQTKGYSYEDFVYHNIFNSYDTVYKFKDTPETVISKTKLYEDYNIYIQNIKTVISELI